MRRKQDPRFQTASRHTYRIDLVLDFAAPVTAVEAKEVARRILDRLQLSTEHARMGAGFRNAELLCHPLHRVVGLTIPSQTAEGSLQLRLDALDDEEATDGMGP